MSAPLDYKYLDWPLSGDLFSLDDPMALAGPLLKFARLFASSMSPVWGGFLGFKEPEYDEKGKLIDKQPVAVSPKRLYSSETSQIPQPAADVTVWNDHMSKSMEDLDYRGAEMTLKYPWFLLDYWDDLFVNHGADGRSSHDVDPCIHFRDADKYKNLDLSRKVNYRRNYVSQRLRYAGESDTFAIIVYRFLKAEMGEYIRNYLENIHRSDYQNPQPKLLLYLYEHLSYLMDLKSTRTLDYLYSKLPEIIYPYRVAFWKASTCKESEWLYDLTWPFGITTGMEGFSPQYDALGISPDYGVKKSEWFSQSLDSKFDPGRDWWHAILKDHLPDSFLNLNSIGADVRFSMGDDLEQHLDDFSYIYQTYAYKIIDHLETVENVYRLKEPPWESVNSNDILDWYEIVIDSILGHGTSDQKNQKAMDEELEDVENLDFSLCEIDPSIIPPSSECGFCLPNPDAIVPDWTELTSSEPFLNEKTCEYSISMLTPHKNVGTDRRFSKITAAQIKPGLTKLLKFYNKDSSEETVNKLLPEAAAADYYVPTRAHLKIKVLVTISADVLNGVKEAGEAGGSDNKDGTGAPGGTPAPKSVVLKAGDIRRFFRVTKAKMFYYGISYEVAIFLGASLVYPGLYFGPDNVNGTLANGIKLYRSKLIRFLRKNKFIINPLRKNLAKLEEVTLNFTDDFSLLSVVAKKMGCPPEEVSRGFEEFKNMSPINDPTISRIVAQLPQIVPAITGKEAMQWQEFASSYVGIEGMKIPPIEPTSAKKDSGDCNAGAVLYGIGKPVVAIGTQMFGQILSFPQLFVSQVGLGVCYSLEKKKKKDLKLDDPKTQMMRYKEQWSRQLKAGDSVFENVPQILSEMDNLDDLFTDLIDKLGVCGIAALINISLDCIISGISEEVSLKSLVVARIKNLSDKQLEGLFFQLNPALRDLIKNSVDEITSIPLPWEAGYQAGSYIGAGKTYANKAIEVAHKKSYASVGIEVLSSGKQYEEEYVLEWPEECPEGKWFYPPKDPYGYRWKDYDTLEFKDTRPGGSSGTAYDLSSIAPDNSAWSCRPVEVLVFRPLTDSSSETGEDD